MKTYIGVTVIQAEPMTADEFEASCLKHPFGKGDGYKIVYIDDYVSWAPKAVFDAAYREVDAAEALLVCRSATCPANDEGGTA